MAISAIFRLSPRTGAQTIRFKVVEHTKWVNFANKTDPLSAFVQKLGTVQ